MRFDLTDLSLFRHVVEAGSITHGAERAHLALAAASTRIRNMEQALGAPLLVRARHGVTPTQAGRTLLQHARTMLEQAERLREDLGAYAGGLAGQVRVLSNTNALTEFLPEALERVPGRPSQRQRRSRGAAERRDRRADRRGRRRHRHRRRHGRCRAADHLSVPQRPLRAGGGARPSAGEESPRSASPRCSTTTSSASTGPAPSSASSAARPTSIGRPLRLRVQLRSFDAVCRLVECNVGVGVVPATTARRAAKSMAIKAVDLADPWALRDLTICIRDFDGAAALCAPARRAHAGRGELAAGRPWNSIASSVVVAWRGIPPRRITMRILKLFGTAGAAALLAAAVAMPAQRRRNGQHPAQGCAAARPSATST